MLRNRSEEGSEKTIVLFIHKRMNVYIILRISEICKYSNFETWYREEKIGCKINLIMKQKRDSTSDMIKLEGFVNYIARNPSIQLLQHL